MIFFDVFRVNALFFLEFESGAKEVLESAPLVLIKVIHQIDQIWFIESVIAEELAHMGPVFLFDVSAIVFAVGAGAGELSGRRPVGQIPVQMVIEEFGAVIAIEAEDGERKSCFNVLDLCHYPERTLFQVARFSVQPERISVRVRLQTKSPAKLLPQCATVSASTKPGRLTSQCSVRMGIWFLSKVPGLVPHRPRLPDCARIRFNSRSMLRGLMASSRVLTGSGKAPYPARSRAATARWQP